MSRRLLTNSSLHTQGQILALLRFIFGYLDGPLLLGIVCTATYGFFILYSASQQHLHTVLSQAVRFVLGTVLMVFLTHIPPTQLRRISPPLFIAGVLLLIVVLLVGHTGKGAQRWLGLGAFRFQPSEFMKIALPLMIAWSLSEHPLPPSFRTLAWSVLWLGLPFLLTAKQPDLGTALIIASTGMGALVFAGLPWTRLLGFVGLLGASGPLLWHFMHDYQKQRVLTFLDS